MRLKKIVTIAVSTLVVLGIAIGGFLYGFYNIGVKPAETKTVTVGDGTSLKVGLISDTQLSPTKGVHDNYVQNLTDALTLLKEQGVELLVHAGDIGDMNSSHAYKTFNKALDAVFGDSKPETLFIMGNHDTWWNTDWNNSKPKARKFNAIIGNSPWLHKVVNGFHFIGASPDGTKNTAGYSKEVISWMETQIQAAEKDNPGLPIFVITHHNPEFTAYGSDEWYDDNLDTLFSKYPNVVSISGHSHYSIMDERSIYQNSYTAFTTQALAYVNLNKEFFDPFRGGLTDLPAHDEEYPMMEIMNVDQDGATIERWNVKEKKEEKADRRWTLTFPLSKETFTYSTAQREAVNQAPQMNDSTVTFQPAVKNTKTSPAESDPKTLPGISFKAGSDDDLVHSYKVIIRGTKEAEYLYLSDFCSGVSTMSDTVNLAVDTNLPAGEYQVKVYAVDSFGLVSADCAQGTIQLTK